MTRESILTLIASLVIAFGVRIALSPSLSATKETLFEAKLEFRGVPDDMMVVGAKQTWSIKATGTGQYLDQLDPSSVTAYVDLSLARPGNRWYLVEVSPPARAKVSVAPRNPRIRLDIQKVGTVPQKVTVEPSGQTPRDFVFDGSSALPDRVNIVGPESVLSRVKKARVNLDLDQVRPGASFMLPVEVLDEENQVLPYVRSDPAEVSVSPAVAAAPTKKRLLVIPNWSGQPSFGYKVVSYEIRPSQIELRGDSATISRIATIDTEPISLAGLKADATLRVKLKLPPETKSTEMSEVTVIVKVVKRPGTGMPGP